MSRIGKKPVVIPSGVKISVNGSAVAIEGPKGKLALDVHPTIAVAVEDGKLICKRPNDERASKALQGLFRSLLQNMVKGVTDGFERKLEIVGVGFGAVLAGSSLSLTVGFAKAVKLEVPKEVTVKLPDATHIVVSGPDKQKVGQFASIVRSVRKPEPYKGTGIKYEGEQIRRKAGKAFGSAGA